VCALLSGVWLCAKFGLAGSRRVIAVMSDHLEDLRLHDVISNAGTECQAFTHIHTQVCPHMHTHVNSQTHTHTHTHTHANSQTQVDAFGPLKLTCPATGTQCVLEFTPCGWFSYGRHEFSGYVSDAGVYLCCARYIAAALLLLQPISTAPSSSALNQLHCPLNYAS